MKFKKSLFYFILPFFILFFLQLFFSNRLTAEGKELEKVKQEAEKIEIENRYLKNQISSFGSLTKLNLLAEKKGFIKNPPLINLSKEKFLRLSLNR